MLSLVFSPSGIKQKYLINPDLLDTFNLVFPPFLQFLQILIFYPLYLCILDVLKP